MLRENVTGCVAFWTSTVDAIGATFTISSTEPIAISASTGVVRFARTSTCRCTEEKPWIVNVIV